MNMKYSLLMDEETEDFVLMDGDLVLAADELSVIEWLNCNLGVEENAYEIYQDTGIGVPMRELIGLKGSVPIDTIMAAIRTKVEETALQCGGVDSVDNVTLTQNGRTATLHIVVTASNGEIVEADEEVDV